MKEASKYKGWLISDNFMKRCMAVTLYGMLGQLILTAGLFLVMAIVLGIAGSLGILLNS